MKANSEHLRHAMRQWATGVTLVTCAQAQEREGMTVSSFTSVSLTPPLILVSLEIGGATHSLISRVGSFAVSILEESQQAISDRFAGRDPEIQDRFLESSWQLSPLGHPIPVGALAYLDCQVTENHPGGTHTVFLAEVVTAGSLNDGKPLLYFNRSYHQLKA
jgi:flavin reductase (DIM6/NTAB) family NADH-FMN oxidoreductase RutF